MSVMACLRQLSLFCVLIIISLGGPRNPMATWTDEKSRRDKNGKRWNFCFWWDTWTDEKVVQAQRLFFWDDGRTDCGVVLLPPGSVIHYSRVKTLIEKLVANPTLRKQHRRELRFSS